MDIGKFTVHRVSAHKQPRVVTVDGEEMTADVNMMEVELISTDGSHGTLSLRFYKTADRDVANDVFLEGGTVAFSVEKADAPPAVEEAPPEAA